MGEQKGRIAIIDDDSSARKLLQRQLEGTGYQVFAFSDGRAALQPICKMGSGIVIADWSMPGMDGLELCRAVRELQTMQALGRIHFILLTAFNEKDKVIEGFAAGADDYLTKPYHPGELLARVRVGERMLRLQEELLRRNIEVQKANAQMAALAAKLDHLANTDVLTDLPNRRCLFERYQAAWETSRRRGEPLSCVMLDLDRFKKVNDTYGHAAGDQVLKSVAAAIRRHARQPELCGRFGGEEFMLVLPATSSSAAAEVAEEMRTDIHAQPILCGSTRIPVTVSCGVAEATADMASPDELLRGADAMLYLAKEHGRNQTWVLAPDGQGYPARPPSQPAAEPSPSLPPGPATTRQCSRPPLEAIQSQHADSANQR